MSETDKKRQVLGTTSITRKYQLTVPKKAREKFKLDEGDLVMFIEEGGRLYIVKGTDV